MSEETENDGSWGGLKKTIVGTLATIVTGGGVWISTTLFGGGNDSEETKTEQAAPAAAPVINLNLENNNQSNASAGSGGGTTVIREKETIREVAPAQSTPAQATATPAEEKKETPAERMKRLRAKQLENEEEE